MSAAVYSLQSAVSSQWLEAQTEKVFVKLATGNWLHRVQRSELQLRAASCILHFAFTSFTCYTSRERGCGNELRVKGKQVSQMQRVFRDSGLQVCR